MIRKPPLLATVLCLAFAAASAGAQAPATPPAQPPPTSQAPAEPSPTPQPPRPAAPAAATCDKPYLQADLVFANEDAFEQALAKRLAAHPERLTIDLPKPFSPSTPPKRLRSWLGDVQKSRGRITGRPVPCGGGEPPPGRSLAGFKPWWDMRRGPSHDHIREYDAVLWIASASGAVTQIELVRRKPSAAAAKTQS